MNQKNNDMPSVSSKDTIIEQTTIKLMEYCHRNNWAGDDPFDGLNSRVFKALAFLHSRIPRLILTQIMKRSPINFRRLLAVTKSENPKGLAIFLSALFILSKNGILKNEDSIHRLLQRLIDLKSPNTSHCCWGYNFDWQSREFFLPKFVPNIICTTFAGNALLDAYARFADVIYLDMAVSAGDFLLEGLNITKGHDEICFGYTSLHSDRIHNANLLGASYLARLYRMTGKKKFFKSVLSAVRYSTRRQNDDGSWAYGDSPTQRWVDNFHTGYNLCALRTICQCLNTEEFEPQIRRGFQFFRNNFFQEDDAPKYFHDRTYPIDIHSAAQSIITLCALRDLDENNTKLAASVFSWTLSNMWDTRGYFYYQITPYYKNKISYMRWSQAWMLLALATLLDHNNDAGDTQNG